MARSVITFDVWAHPPTGPIEPNQARHLGTFQAFDHYESAISDVRMLLREKNDGLDPADRIEIIRPDGSSLDAVENLPTVEGLLR